MTSSSQEPIWDEKHKSGFFLFVVAATAFILAWGVWNHFRPSVIYSQCAEVAQNTSNLSRGVDLSGTGFDYDTALNDCLSQTDLAR